MVYRFFRYLIYLHRHLSITEKTVWYYVKFEDNLNFCFLTNPKKFVPLSIDYGPHP